MVMFAPQRQQHALIPALGHGGQHGAEQAEPLQPVERTVLRPIQRLQFGKALVIADRDVHRISLTQER